MKKVGIIIFAVALVVGIVISNMFSVGQAATTFFNFSCNFKGVRGSGNLASETRNLSNFKAVEVGGIFKVEITAQKEFSVVVEADDNLIKLITTEVSDGVLTIKTAKKISPREEIRIIISAPDIERLDISGVSSVSLSDLNNASLTVDSSGASKINLSGKTAELRVDVSGASKVDAEELQAVNGDIDASGASTVLVNVTGDLKTQATGASKIVYTGTPANLEKSAHGASRVSQK